MSEPDPADAAVVDDYSHIWDAQWVRERAFIARVKLGWKEFDVDSKEIYAGDCDVLAADLALFAARVKRGEISRVKTLNLVIYFVVLFLLHNSFRLACAALHQR